ncbi:MAG: pyridoxal phosphate-dependent aminotransferase, partial [Alphaproteobacteria bacterium]|nr:pyridoxal phosphate-dependent aminotransferase [Alphaproteobacteria bacterium]
MLRLADNLNRLGTETAFEVLARAAKLQAEGRDIVNLGIGQPDFKTPPHVVEAAAQALRDGHHGYTPANGIPALREAVAADIARFRGVEVDPDLVMIMPGGKPTMFFAIMMFGEPGAEIVYPNPGFPIYESMIEYSGATPVAMALHEENGFAFSADEVLAQIGPATRLLILNSPANPTGGVAPKAEMDKLVAGLEDHPHVAILSDEIYSRLLYEDKEHVSLLGYESLRERTILLDGWSKTYAMTGWRLGYSVWPKALFPLVERLAVNCHSCVNAATQYAGIAALNGPQDAVETMRRAFDARRRIIVRALNQLPGFRCVDPGGAFYTFPNI